MRLRSHRGCCPRDPRVQASGLVAVVLPGAKGRFLKPNKTPTFTQSALRALLSQPVVATTTLPATPSSLAVQIRAAASKNLASLLAPDDATAGDALRLYCDAVSLGGPRTDVVAARALAQLAGELGAWTLARRGLEAALHAAPRHPLALEALADVCLRVGDWKGAAAAAHALLTIDPGHTRAAELAAGATARGGGVEPAWPGRARPAAALATPPLPQRALSIASPTWPDTLAALARVVAPVDGRPFKGRRLCDAVSVTFRSEEPAPRDAADAAAETEAGKLKPTPAPVRASARLVDGDGTPIDALAGVLPWLGAAPAGEEGGEGGGAATTTTTTTTDDPRVAADLAAEADAVRALVTGPASSLGLGALAAAALDAAASTAHATLPRRALLALLRLDRPLRAWPRSPAACLTLAELHAAAAADPVAVAGGEREGDGGGARARRAAEAHAASAAACLAGAGAAVAAIEAASVAGASPDDRALVARYRWTAARLAEGARAPGAAGDHLCAASAALETAPSLDIDLPHARCLLAGSTADAGASVTPSSVAARLQALGLVEALATGRARLASDDPAAAAALVADLAPRVLAPAGRRSRSGGGDARRQLLEAALLLQDAATAAKARAPALRARALILSHMLPKPPPGGVDRDFAAVAGPADGPPPPGVADPSRVGRAALERALADTTAFATDLAAEGPAAISEALADGGSDDVLSVLWQVAAHVERCFWAGSTAARAPGAPGPSPATAASALANAAAALVALWRLDPAAPRGGGALGGLLMAVGSLLSVRRVAGARRAPLLRAAAHTLTAELETGGAADADVTAALAGAHAACLHALYGAALPSRDPSWPPVAGLDVPPTGFADLVGGGLDACREAWRLLAPAVGTAVAAADAAAAEALTGPLLALQAACPDPDTAVLEAWSPEGLLDGEGPSDGDLLGAAGAASAATPVNPATLTTLLRVPPTLTAAIAADPGTTLHAALHPACLPLAGAAFARAAASAARGAWLTGGDADAALAAAARGPLLAVRYTPTSPDGWRALAAMHAAAADALLSDAAHAPARWAADVRARGRHATIVTRARRAALVWRATAGGGGGRRGSCRRCHWWSLPRGRVPRPARRAARPARRGRGERRGGRLHQGGGRESRRLEAPPGSGAGGGQSGRRARG